MVEPKIDKSAMHRGSNFNVQIQRAEALVYPVSGKASFTSDTVDELIKATHEGTISRKRINPKLNICENNVRRKIS